MAGDISIYIDGKYEGGCNIGGGAIGDELLHGGGQESAGGGAAA